MTTPLVSILIPVHDAERFIVETVESALAQTHPAVEVVCVDDGSTDGSLERLRGFGDRIVLETGPKRGACAARNRALALSRGEFVQFFDADDVLHPDKIERQLPKLLADEADLVFCNIRVVRDDGGESIKPSMPCPDGMDAFVYCLEHAPLGGISLMTTGSPLHRRSKVEAVGGFRDGVRVSQDKDLAYRLAAADARFHYVEEVLFTYRDHGAPRISTRERPRSYPTRLLLEIARIVSAGPPYRMTPARRRALARELVRLAIDAYKEDPAICGAALREARRLSPDYLADAAPGYRAVARLLGASGAERLMRATVRSNRIRRRLRGFPV